jgi:hypothetical protein
MQIQSAFDHIILSTCYAGEFNLRRGRIKISHRFNHEGRLDFGRAHMRRVCGSGTRYEAVYIEVDEKALQRWLLLLAPPKKKRPRDPVRGARRASVKELDALAREVVFARDGNECRMCVVAADRRAMDKTRQLQWCHIYSRRYKWLRWDISNSMVLCAAHHIWQHHNPAAAMPIVESILGRKEYAALKMRAAKPQKADTVKWKLYLEQERKKLAPRGRATLVAGSMDGPSATVRMELKEEA